MSECAVVNNDILLLANGILHRKVMPTVDTFIRKDVSDIKSMGKYRYWIVEYLEPDEVVGVDASISNDDDAEMDQADDSDNNEMYHIDYVEKTVWFISSFKTLPYNFDMLRCVCNIDIFYAMWFFELKIKYIGNWILVLDLFSCDLG